MSKINEETEHLMIGDAACKWVYVGAGHDPMLREEYDALPQEEKDRLRDTPGPKAAVCIFARPAYIQVPEGVTKDDIHGTPA